MNRFLFLVVLALVASSCEKEPDAPQVEPPQEVAFPYGNEYPNTSGLPGEVKEVVVYDTTTIDIPPCGAGWLLIGGISLNGDSVSALFNHYEFDSSGLHFPVPNTGDTISVVWENDRNLECEDYSHFATHRSGWVYR